MQTAHVSTGEARWKEILSLKTRLSALRVMYPLTVRGLFTVHAAPSRTTTAAATTAARQARKSDEIRCVPVVTCSALRYRHNCRASLATRYNPGEDEEEEAW